MVKNAVDVVFGGISYWMVGYGLSHGDAPGSNPVVGFGRFFVDAEPDEMGWLYSDFIFHLSFATTATTIVSGAMAERTKLSAYIVFSFINTIIYSFPAHWVWADNGFLRQMGVVDIAGVTLSYIFQKRHIKINYLINGVLGALVSITGACAIAAPWEGIVIGFVGAVLALAAAALCRKLHIDDPVDVVPVHGVCSIWGMLAIGIFVAEDKVQSLTFGRSGFLRGGGGMLLAVQALACVVIFVWSALVAFILLK
ncbi:PREDICTED: putative ammonium transporter 3, partial [Priapulus caudatus]|uniref:Ammonium transporter 3 n=1 Tax=Priapulus caudatus TaxID=37621 RepID=A0ABM1ED01_PRICU